MQTESHSSSEPLTTTPDLKKEGEINRLPYILDPHHKVFELLEKNVTKNPLHENGILLKRFGFDVQTAFGDHLFRSARIHYVYWDDQLTFSPELPLRARTVAYYWLTRVDPETQTMKSFILYGGSIWNPIGLMQEFENQFWKANPDATLQQAARAYKLMCHKTKAQYKVKRERQTARNRLLSFPVILESTATTRDGIEDEILKALFRFGVCDTQHF